MVRVVGIELYELDLPFRHAFHHAAAVRACSTSLFVRLLTDSGHQGYGETLPRGYVTGEERGAVFDLLAERLLPRLIGMHFSSFEAVHDFLAEYDGTPPRPWLADDASSQVHSAAWCAVDVALLDTFARAFGRELHEGLPGQGKEAGAGAWPEGLLYSVVLSGETGRHALMTLLKVRAYGIRDVKVKVDGRAGSGVRLARRVLGGRARLRVDSNMSWSYEEAAQAMASLSAYGVESFEQPLAANDLEGMARLTADTGLAVVADESFNDAASLDRLIAAGACTGVNVRISKCGGVVASLARCRRALTAGLTLHIGCQVGETSQLSAAQMVLVRTLAGGVSHIEGCFGERLLAADPVRPLLQFGRHGRPPGAPRGPGLGTDVDMGAIQRHSGRRFALGTPLPQPIEESR